MVMSGGQYEFKRLKGASNNKSQGGLELNVVDHYNGTERSVKLIRRGVLYRRFIPGHGAVGRNPVQRRGDTDGYHVRGRGLWQLG